MPNQETTIKEHTEHSDSVNPGTNRCQRHRKLRLAALALAATWIPFSGQAEIQEGQPEDAAPIQITEVEADDTNLGVTWTSVQGDIYDVMVTQDLQNFSHYSERVGNAGFTTTQVPLSEFGNSEHGFVRIRKSPYPTLDPATQIGHPCYYWGIYNYNYPSDGIGVVNGRIHWPSNACTVEDGPPNDSPVVIFMHGNGMDNDDHDYLMRHLARNGFVAASIANGGSNEERAAKAISYLNSLHRFWTWRNKLSNKVVFAGHSRGGEAAVTAARMLAESPSMAYTPYDVRSVVSIAPTDGGSTGLDTKESLDGSMSRSFLGIYGSRDGDVMGTRLAASGIQPERTAFAIYDRAGSESSSEGILWPQANIKKSMVFVHGANHNGFKSGGFGTGWQKDIAKSYFNAFLRWHVFGQEEYSAYFDGSATPKTVCENDSELYTQFSDTLRRVIDNFEQGGWAVNTRGGTVSKGSGIAQIAEGNLWSLDHSAPHDTRGMRIKWSNQPVASVHWRIPEQNLPFVGAARDVTGFSTLSFRVAQDYLDAWNNEGEEQDFYIRLHSGNGVSQLVKVSDHGSIPYPDPVVVPVNGLILETLPVADGDYTKSAMSTIRIPLDAFEGADLSDVRTVTFQFTVPGHTSGSVIMDSLEFSR